MHAIFRLSEGLHRRHRSLTAPSDLGGEQKTGHEDGASPSEPEQAKDMRLRDCGEGGCVRVEGGARVLPRANDSLSGCCGECKLRQKQAKEGVVFLLVQRRQSTSAEDAARIDQWIRAIPRYFQPGRLRQARACTVPERLEH